MGHYECHFKAIGGNGLFLFLCVRAGAFVLYGFACCSEVLYGFASCIVSRAFCMVLGSGRVLRLACFRMVMYGYVWFCMVLYGCVRLCMILNGSV